MAFEVDRLHRLISSRVGDEGVFNAFRTGSHPVEPDQSFSRSCSPYGTYLQAHYPAGFLYDTRGSDQGCETNSLPLESSSCSTETESDEDDHLLESLAQQIAQSMLDDEETKVDICAGVLKGNVYSEARDFPNVDMNEVSIRISLVLHFSSLGLLHFYRPWPFIHWDNLLTSDMIILYAGSSVPLQLV
jgi:hypothetical protein